MIALLIYLLVVVVGFIVVKLIIDAMGLEPPLRKVALLVLGLIALVAILIRFAAFAGVG